MKQKNHWNRQNDGIHDNDEMLKKEKKYQYLIACKWRFSI